jgi:two-component system nitrogen regulation sensor histidine kinase NtrY
MRWPGRFEWKIFGAMLGVAVVSGGVAAYALRYELAGFVGLWRHDREAGDAAGRAADVFRAYFADRKEEFNRRTEAVAAQPPGRLAELALVDDLLHARLLEGATVIDEWHAPPDVLKGAREAPPFIAEVASHPPEGRAAGPRQPLRPPRILELTFGIPIKMYGKFLELTSALDAEKQRERIYDVYLGSHVSEYLKFVGGLLVVVPLAGLFFARRATRRVARLHDAARRVGEGDLTVQVAPTGRDELDELGRAFDRMVRELADTRSRLEYLQKVSAWQEVARRLAHEIKNPLTPIQLAVQELASKYRGDDPAYRRLLGTATEILNEEITSLRRLVDDFSAFAKLPKVAPAPLDLGAFVAEFARLHPEWQPHIEVSAPPAPVTAPCDRMLFGRVLANLVENAVQAAEGAGRTPRVRLSVESRPARGRAAIIVDDNGPGVPPADRQRVFDPYLTTKPNGTGLGLAIVRKIVIDHGGDVSIAPTPSPLEGARFEVEIPAG